MAPVYSVWCSLCSHWDLSHCTEFNCTKLFCGLTEHLWKGKLSKCVLTTEETLKLWSKQEILMLEGNNTGRLRIISVLTDHIKFYLFLGKQRWISSFQTGAHGLHRSSREFVPSELLHVHSLTAERQKFRWPQTVSFAVMNQKCMASAS